MERETIKEANKLAQDVDELTLMVQTLKKSSAESGCSVVGFGLKGDTIVEFPMYQFNIHSLFPNNKDFKSRIARAGVEAMRIKAIDLLKEAEDKLKAL